jgi:DNA polymerase III epsilon subunit family exonuclease
MGQIEAGILAYLDVETTGLSAWFGDRICEIAVIRCEGENVIASFDGLINPGRPISPGAARVNGLRDSDLIDAPHFSEIAEQVLALLDDAVIVCHNAPFDLGFLTSELGRIRRPLPPVPTLDTLVIARDHFHFRSNSLQAIAGQLGIEVAVAHRALDDALTTREVLGYFSEKLGWGNIEPGISTYYPRALGPETLDLPPAIEEALQSKRRLFIHYVDGKGNASERWITPRQVLAQNDYLYLVAHCHLREEERHFRLDRIVDMEIGLEPAAGQGRRRMAKSR